MRGEIGVYFGLHPNIEVAHSTFVGVVKAICPRKVQGLLVEERDILSEIHVTPDPNGGVFWRFKYWMIGSSWHRVELMVVEGGVGLTTKAQSHSASHQNLRGAPTGAQARSGHHRMSS